LERQGATKVLSAVGLDRMLVERSVHDRAAVLLGEHFDQKIDPSLGEQVPLATSLTSSSRKSPL
jgi:hypothetical protein